MTTDERVLDLLTREGEALAVTEMAPMLDLSSRMVRGAVRRLIADGKVEALGTSASGARCFGIVKDGGQEAIMTCAIDSITPDAAAIADAVALGAGHLIVDCSEHG